MDDFDFLDEEQESAIRQFFQNFSIEKHTELKEKFISLWDKLGDIYRNYRSRLTTLGIAYEGMLYRNVIEALDTDTLRYDKYVFVGFNVLNTVETRSSPFCKMPARRFSTGIMTFSIPDCPNRNTKPVNLSSVT